VWYFALLIADLVAAIKVWGVLDFAMF